MIFVTIACVLGAGLIAGVFLAFSSFVMRALASVPPREGLAAMQAINVTVINPLFLSVFIGTAIASLATAAYALFHWQESGSTLLLSAGIAYVVGCFLVTIAFNVPMNDALALLDRDRPESQSQWAEYLRRWTFWNHVRTVASLVSAGLFAASLLVQ